MIEGTLRAINIPVATGTIRSHGVIWNFSFSAAATSVICCVLLASCENPATAVSYTHLTLPTKLEV